MPTQHKKQSTEITNAQASSAVTIEYK